MMIEARQVVFPEPNVVQLETFAFDPTPTDNEIVIRTLASIISAGTELVCLSWAKLPFRPGYGAVGEVIAVGKDVQDIQVGDVVLTYSNHASHAKARVVAVKVPDGLEPAHAVFARMANVAITALRVGDAELGDKVAVIGLGLVGNFAAQLFQLAGCEVVGIDVVDKRLELARACGIATTVNTSEVDPIKAVKAFTDGKGCEAVVEASGNPQAALLAAELAGKNGEVILLGSPQRPLEANVTELLNRIHLWRHGCVTFKGAHEWRYPVREDPQGFVKHTIERNAKLLLKFIADGKLKVAPLLTNRLSPEECAKAYTGLREQPDKFVGAVFDWQIA